MVIGYGLLVIGYPFEVARRWRGGGSDAWPGHFCIFVFPMIHFDVKSENSVKIFECIQYITSVGPHIFMCSLICKRFLCTCSLLLVSNIVSLL